MRGSEASLYDFDGTPPLPLELNDESMSSLEGHTQGLPGNDLMIGFNAAVKVFRILGACQLRRRLSVAEDQVMSRDALVPWIDSQFILLNAILEDLPPQLQIDVTSPPLQLTDAQGRAFVGIQQSNIQITMLCTKFALVCDL